MKKELIFELLKVLSKNSTCRKMDTAALIIKDKVVVSLGYNGAVRGSIDCKKIGCINIDNHCQTAVHAEENCIINAARVGVDIHGGIAWSLHMPCRNCLKHLVNCGIKEIHYFYPYKDEANETLANRYEAEGLVRIMREEIGA